mgnify:CR=1 FL=1
MIRAAGGVVSVGIVDVAVGAVAAVVVGDSKTAVVAAVAAVVVGSMGMVAGVEACIDVVDREQLVYPSLVVARGIAWTILEAAFDILSDPAKVLGALP